MPHGFHPLKTLRTAGLCLAIAAAPVTATAETLADTLIAAYRNSNLLDQQRAVLRAADEDVAQAIATLRPTLDFIANFQYQVQNGEGVRSTPANSLDPTVTSSFELLASVSLFEGGRRILQREVQKETVLATREALVQVEQDVLVSAMQSFFTVLSRVAFVDLRQNNVRLITEELQAARDRFEVGEVTRTDVALAESRLAEARSLLAAARGDLEVARQQFRTAVGRFPQGLVQPSSTPALPDSVDEAMSIAVRRHPRIREAQRNVTVAELGVDVARTAYAPSISLNASTNLAVNPNAPSGNEVTPSQTLSLRAEQRLYSGGQFPSQERQAMARRDQARAALHQSTLTVSEAVGAAWARVEAARAQLAATDQQIRAAEIAFEGTREEARLGARTTLDVLDAEQDLLNARTSRIEAVAQQYIAIYQLLSAMGLMTVEHLNLGLQTYDPVAYYNAVDSAPARASPQGERLDRVLRRLGKD